MSKAISIISILVLFYSVSFSQSKKKVEMPFYPSYKVVVNQFFSQYSSGIQDDAEQLKFAKKPDGWHAMLVRYTDYQVTKDELFWSRKKNQYLEIDFPHYVEASIDPNHGLLQNDWWSITTSELVPYWGYKNWELDVIKDYAGKKNLSDSILNALARAYSSYAHSITGNSGFGSGPGIQLPKGQNAFSPEQLNEYLKYQHNAIDAYYKLYQQNPKFETFVADIFNVYSNEIMNTFLTLRYLQNEGVAQKELKKGLYDGFYLEMARNYLNSCDKDAILFTNGDMDTYPLLYVQETENFRKDVLVVNLSLLNLGRYITHLQAFKAGALPMKTGMESDFYKSEAKNFFIFGALSEGPVKMADVLASILSDDENLKHRLTNGDLIDLMPSKEIYFEPDRSSTDAYQIYTTEPDSIIHISFSKNYIVLSEFCLIDAIAANQFKRPVCFAVTVPNENFEFISDYLSLEGMVLKLIPLRSNQPVEFEAGIVYQDLLYNKLFTKLQFTKTKGIFCDSHIRMAKLYRNVFRRLSDDYARYGNKEKSLEVADYCMKTFPDELVRFDYSIFPFITNYFMFSEDEKALKTIQTCLKSAKKEIERLKNSGATIDINERIAFEVYALRELLNITEAHIPDNEVNTEIRKLIEKNEIPEN